MGGELKKAFNGKRVLDIGCGTGYWTQIFSETADSILLYALGRDVFVVDTYTSRVAVRHGLIEPEHDYEQLQELFQSNLPADRALYNEYHALLVRVGKQFCRPAARCSGCPLEELPHTLEPDYF